MSNVSQVQTTNNDQSNGYGPIKGQPQTSVVNSRYNPMSGQPNAQTLLTKKLEETKTDNDTNGNSNTGNNNAYLNQANQELLLQQQQQMQQQYQQPLTTLQTLAQQQQQQQQLQQYQQQMNLLTSQQQTNLLGYSNLNAYYPYTNAAQQQTTTQNGTQNNTQSSTQQTTTATTNGGNTGNSVSGTDNNAATQNPQQTNLATAYIDPNQYQYSLANSYQSFNTLPYTQSTQLPLTNTLTSQLPNMILPNNNLSFLSAAYNPITSLSNPLLTGRTSNPNGVQYSLFVFHLPEDIDDHGLLTLFAPFGALRANVMRHDNGRSRGFGFVHFNTKHEAQIAIDMMNGHQIGRKRLRVSFKRDESKKSINISHNNSNNINNPNINVSKQDLTKQIEQIKNELIKNEENSKK